MADNNKCDECGLKAPRHRKTCSLRPDNGNNNSSARSKAVAKTTAKEATSLLDAVNAASGGDSKTTKKEERYHITGMEDLASRLRAQKAQLESLETEHEKDKAALADHCKKVRLDLEHEGQLHTTLLVDSNDHDNEGNMLPVMAVFQDKYSKKKATPELEAVLKEALGKHHDALVARKESISLKKDVTLAKIKEELGDEAYTKLLALVTTKEEITLKNGFMQTRFDLRNSMSKNLNEQVDALAEGLRHNPQIRSK